MNITLLSSPLQGFTDYRFRNAFNLYFGGIDVFYAPYIRFAGKMDIKPAIERDLNPENNSGIILVPQVMTNRADEFLYVVKYIKLLGYTELNWNLGCPYPMVTNRKLGAGLLGDLTKIEEILRQVFSETDILISIKMRLGNKSSDEIYQVLSILEKFPIKNIAIHPRIARQMYKGHADIDAFEECLKYTSHQIIYNGDITSVNGFLNLAERFPNIYNWMIGRGLISDPFLPLMIKNNSSLHPENKIEIFNRFHETLLQEYSQTLSGTSHLIMKMASFWEYFICLFPNAYKGLKLIKKAKSIHAYEYAVRTILDSN